MKRPYNDRGRFIPITCPASNCGSGKLQDEGDGLWLCDGLAQPERDDQPLYACGFIHVDGEPNDPNQPLSMMR